MKEKKKTFLSFDCVTGSHEPANSITHTFLPREINEEKLGKEG